MELHGPATQEELDLLRNGLAKEIADHCATEEIVYALECFLDTTEDAGISNALLYSTTLKSGTSLAKAGYVLVHALRIKAKRTEVQ
jgi:SET domain-containing protein